MNIRKLLIILLSISFMVSAAQDIITKRDGNDIKSIVIEILPNAVKYRNHDNQKGPIYTLNKSEVFMIKYENGSKDIFASQTASDLIGSKSATIYFYRPKKFASGRTKIIVGTVEPDEVVVTLKNGSWYKMTYEHLGERNFVAGVFSLNTETYKLNIIGDKTYYIKCSVLTKGLLVMAELEFIDKTIALKEMEGLRKQKVP
ncbi:hypothetical protein [Ekhidna sp.]